MTHYDVTKYEMTKDDLSYTALDGMREMLQNGCHIQLQNKVSLARIICRCRKHSNGLMVV